MHHFRATITTGEDTPVSNMRVQVLDQRNSTPVPISLIENGALIKNGETFSDADGKIEFWSPHPSGIKVCGYGPSGDLVYYERVAVVEIANNLNVSTNEGYSVVNDDSTYGVNVDGWPTPAE
jgi:hypothetical protein